MKKTISLNGRIDSDKFSVLYLLSSLNNQLRNLKNHNEINVDLTGIDYFDSNITVILYAYLDYLKIINKKIKIKPPSMPAVKEVLHKNNFCLLLGGEKIEDEKNTYMQIELCNNLFECIEYCKIKIMPKLEIVQMPIYYQFEFISSLLELMDNSFRRGNAQKLYLCGQYFPQRHELKLTMLNFGTTIKENVISYLNKNKNSLNTINYINWARQSGNSTAGSSGEGIPRFLNIINELNSEVCIFSDNEVFEQVHEDNCFEAKGFKFKGTIINIKFNLNNNNFVNINKYKKIE